MKKAIELTPKDCKVIASILYDLFLMAHIESEDGKGMCPEAKYYLSGNLKYLDLAKKLS